MMSFKKALAGVILAAALSGCGEQPADIESKPASSPENVPQSAPAARPVSGSTANVSGAVYFDGSAPEPQPLQMAADPFCAAGAGAVSEEIVVNANGTLKNVLVYIKNGLEGQSFPAPSTPAVLDQQGCRYEPHVIGLQAGQPLEIINSDATLHNVHALPKASSEFNLGMPIKGMKIKKTFSKPEVGVKFKCDVHPWMSAYAGIFEHPFYAVTDGEGRFRLKNVPAGSYTVGLWHEKLGEKEAQLTLSGEDAVLDFRLA